MKTAAKRQRFGTAAFEPMRSVRFLPDTDAFEIEFDSGSTYLLPRAELLSANGRTSDATVDSIWIDAETRSGFFVRFADGVEAEASWELVKEAPPR